MPCDSLSACGEIARASMLLTIEFKDWLTSNPLKVRADFMAKAPALSTTKAGRPGKNRRGGRVRTAARLRRSNPSAAGFLTSADEFVESFVTKSGSNSVVECDLAKVEVASSNLVSRSTHFDRDQRQRPTRRFSKGKGQSLSRETLPFLIAFWIYRFT